MTTAFATSDIWLRLGWTMLHYLWVGALISAIAYPGRRLLSPCNPNTRYFYALTTLILLSIAPPVIFLNISLDPESNSLALATNTSSAASISPEPLTKNFNTEISDPNHEVKTTALERFYRYWMTKTSPWMNWTADALPWLWMLGAPMSFVLVGMGWTGAGRIRRLAKPVDNPALLQLHRRLQSATDVSRQVALAWSQRIACPVLVGVFRPMILLPATMISACSIQQMEMVLLHELAHVRRHDNLVNLLQRLIEAALFFQPTIWIVSNWVRREREHCCDQAVLKHINQPLAYANCLTQLASPRQGALLGVAAAQHPLVDRIRAILSPTTQPLRVSRITLLASMFVTLGAVVLIGACTHRSNQSQPLNHPIVQSRQPNPTLENLTLEQQHQASEEVNYKLKKRFQVMLDQTPLNEALETINGKLDSILLVNWEELEKAGVGPNTPITLATDKLSAEQALRLVLQIVSPNATEPISFDIYEDNVRVSTVNELKSLTPTDIRVYDVRDLLEAARVGRNHQEEFGPDDGEPTPAQQIETLVRDTVGRPEDWDAYGGDFSSVREFNGNLIVRTSAKEHQQIKRLLSAMRGAHLLQIQVNSHFLLLDDEAYRFDMQGLLPKDRTIIKDETTGKTIATISYLNREQANQLLGVAKAMNDVALLGSPRIQLYNGQEGIIKLSVRRPYVMGYKKGQGATAFEPIVGVIESGQTLSFQATASDDRKHVDLMVKPRITTLQKMKKSLVSKLPEAKKYELFVETPHVSTWEMEAAVSMPDRAWLLIDAGEFKGNLDDLGLPKRFDNTVKRRLLMLLRPTIIIQEDTEDMLFPGRMTDPPTTGKAPTL